MQHEVQSLVTEEPRYWLDVLSTWRNLHGCEGKKDSVSPEDRLPLQRKSAEETNPAAKRQQTEQVREPVPEEGRVEAGERCVGPERKSPQGCRAASQASLGDPPRSRGRNLLRMSSLAAVSEFLVAVAGRLPEYFLHRYALC